MFFFLHLHFTEYAEKRLKTSPILITNIDITNTKNMGLRSLLFPDLCRISFFKGGDKLYFVSFQIKKVSQEQ